ncbi:hypothetical protein BS47DRAFT_1372023 [Hydnum rufescens UP504]|uniref:Endoplasmic reticulum-Golgi intermediate compartment protein 3 n=1 Tax=Hydnum rufescens UP504 TaxID=1448309 RepID=A0A9P6B0N2_9AGAM|nr:hypothetical protein BS47DRAFT_1372023 [Hydnum rufescens UP504]
MAKGLFNGAFKGIDAFGKTMDDVKVKTRTGGLLTMLSAALILAFTFIEFIDYRRVYVDTSVLVDRSRGEKLTVVLNVTFPKVPCYLVSLDVTDISGDLQLDVSHNIAKTRLTSAGLPVPAALKSSALKSELDMTVSTRGPDYCGSCYGGIEPPTGCCNTCEEVRQSYLNRGWSFGNPDAIEQCVGEHWTEKIQAQSSEGCNVAGRIKVNKVVGNILISPGKSFQQSGYNTNELVSYLRDGEPHHWGHTVEHLAFETSEEEYKVPLKEDMKKKLGMLVQPLDRHFAHARNSHFMFQYFLKVVATRYHFLDGKYVRTHQYSVTTYERDLSTGANPQLNAQGLMASRGMPGQPGAYFNFEISPMLVVHREQRQSFAHFLTSTCAIVGGVLTIAALLDSVLFSATKALKKGGTGPTSGIGLSGKLM